MPCRLGCREGRSSTHRQSWESRRTVRNVRRIVSICLHMKRAKQSATLSESVKIVRIAWQGHQCSSNVFTSHCKRLLSSFSCQCFVKKCSATIHATRAAHADYDPLGFSTEQQLQGFGLEVLRPSPAQADPNLKTPCSEFPACEGRREEGAKLLANQSSCDGTSAFSSYVYDSCDVVKQIPTFRSQKDPKRTELNLAFTLRHMHREEFAESLTLL